MHGKRWNELHLLNAAKCEHLVILSQYLCSEKFDNVEDIFKISLHVLYIVGTWVMPGNIALIIMSHVTS